MEVKIEEMEIKRESIKEEKEIKRESIAVQDRIAKMQAETQIR